MNDTRFYLAQTDDYGVLTVEGYEVDLDDPHLDAEAQVADSAKWYPNVIYFAVEPSPVLHAHIESESSDCDGRYSRTYVMTQTDEELNGSPFDGYDGEEAFRIRVLASIGSVKPEYGGVFHVAPGGDRIEWAESTDEGFRNVEATFCTDDDADEKSTQRDHSAEAAGY